MPTALQSNTHTRLKCGEVFVWDCVGELFTIECWLCEERPLCALTEFAEHMDVWHSDWIAEAYATLLDTATTTSTASDEYELLPKCGAPMSQHINESASAELWHIDACSESDNFENTNSESAAQLDMEVEKEEEGEVEAAVVAVSESGSEHDKTIVLEAAANTEFLTGVCTTVSNAGFLHHSEGEFCETCNETEYAAQVQKSGTAASRATNAGAMNVVLKKRVESSIDQRLKTEKLIQIYEKFPELWHTQQRDHFNTDTHSKAYHSISRELREHGINLKASAVQRRLNALRKLFRLEKLEELKSHGEGRLHKSTFEYYAQLQFLKEHIEPQLCRACKRICKDATECCGGVKETGQEGTDEMDQVKEPEHTEKVEVTRENDGDTLNELAEQVIETLVVGETMESNETKIACESGIKAPPTNTEANESELRSAGHQSTAKFISTNLVTNEDAPQPINSLKDGSFETIEPASPSGSIHTSTDESMPTSSSSKTSTIEISECVQQITDRTPRKRNEIEILEVLELPKFHLFNTQQSEVSTSMTLQGAADGKNFDAISIPDELIAFEEYDSSNGDSGIMRDCDDNNTEEIESFARLTTEQTHKLIQLFGKYPILWDPDHIDYRLRERRRRAWREMTAQINEQYGMHYNWMTLHRKMNDYIKYYRRERRRIELEGGTTRWCFYDDFIFLAEVSIEQNSNEPKHLWSKMQNLKVIEVYAAYPQLWNTEHPDFKRRRLRQSFFRVMSDQLCCAHGVNLAPAKLKQRVAELRCAFRLEKERRSTAAQKGEIYESKYEYYQQLSFLEPHIAPFTCATCGLQSKKHREIERHKRTEHSNKKKQMSLVSATSVLPTAEVKKPATLDNICYICGMSFTLNRSLACHLKRHTNQRKYPCSQCPKRFFDGASLRLHERSHTKSRPYVCDQCGKGYVSGGKLNQHMKRHTGQRDYPCEICDKAFYSSFECERHMRTHMNIREKVCPICGKDFGVGSSYYAHMLLHSDVKKYQCKMCCKQFAQFAGLYKHRRRYHPVEFASERAKKNNCVAKNGVGCAN